MAARPTREERIQSDLDELLGQLGVLAKTLLIRNGEFFPFGATISKRGRYALVVPVPEADRPTAHDVVDAVFAEIRSTRDTLRACGTVAMATTASGVDAVRIELEHCEGSSIVVALPYAKGDLGAFAYGDLEARRAERRVWPAETKKPARPPKTTPRPAVAAKTPAPAKPEPRTRGASAPRPPRETAKRPTLKGTHRPSRGTRQPLTAQMAPLF